MVTETQTTQSGQRTAGRSDRVLDVRDLRVSYHTARGPVRAVSGVSFFLKAGERLGLVGESGSGKTTTALSLMRLIQEPAVIEGGEALLDGRDLLSLSEDEMRRMRFAEIALIPQGAMNSLNPVMKVGEQLRDTVRAHTNPESNAKLDTRIHDALESVDLRATVMESYPHELSGGMKQRVCIAMGILLSPKVIIADEPTSALDVVVQRQVMEALGRVQKDLGASVILVGHDMGLMAQFVDRVGVMYGGKLVEVGPVRDIFKYPLHPYTQALIGSLPNLQSKEVFRGIPGLTPSLLTPPPGCMFHPRCPKAMQHCSAVIPSLQEIKPDRWVACHLYDGSQS
ncbi:MAG: ABC transporter ATP-binding protein [Thermomicrobiales bacterium]|nr:ABC transporter ATP-binding protein [Thermomicrobiales bacterium]